MTAVRTKVLVGETERPIEYDQSMKEGIRNLVPRA